MFGSVLVDVPGEWRESEVMWKKAAREIAVSIALILLQIQYNTKMILLVIPSGRGILR